MKKFLSVTEQRPSKMGRLHKLAWLSSWLGVLKCFNSFLSLVYHAIKTWEKLLNLF